MVAQATFSALTDHVSGCADVMFPLGGMRKEQVRRLAKERSIPSALRQSSAGICFIGAHRACLWNHECVWVLRLHNIPLFESCKQAGRAKSNMPPFTRWTIQKVGSMSAAVHIHNSLLMQEEENLQTSSATTRLLWQGSTSM